MDIFSLPPRTMTIGHQLVLFIAVNGCQSFHLTTPLTRSLSSSSSSLDRHVLVLPPLSRTRDDRLLLHRRRGIEFDVPSLRVSLNEDDYLTNENDEELSYAVVRPTPSLIDAPTNPADDFSFVTKKFKSFLLSMSAFLLPLFILFSLSNPAWAVQSGGRMGGSFGGGGGASQSSSRSYRSSSPSSYGGNSRGYTSGGYGYSRPSTNVIISPGINPFYSPFGYSPFYSPYYARPSGVIVNTGPSFGSIFFFAGFCILVSTVLQKTVGTNSSFGGGGTSFVGQHSVLGPGVSVIEMSIALDVSNRDDPNSILSVLDRLARTAKTDSRVGVQNLTSQVALELLRRKASFVAAHARGRHYRDETEAQREYNGVTIRERGKFQRETISKFGGVDYSSGGRGQLVGTSRDDEYNAKTTVAVVTIMMLIDGDSTSKALPARISSIRDAEEVLSRIATDARADECLRGAEILWTPEERDETLTMREVLADYPNLRSI